MLIAEVLDGEVLFSSSHFYAFNVIMLLLQLLHVLTIYATTCAAHRVQKRVLTQAITVKTTIASKDVIVQKVSCCFCLPVNCFF